jgi:hypothetical protein
MRVPVRRTGPFVITADPPGLLVRSLDALALPRLVAPTSTQLELFAAEPTR